MRGQVANWKKVKLAMKTTDICDLCGKLDPEADTENGNHVCDECIDKYCIQQEIEWKKKLH